MKSIISKYLAVSTLLLISLTTCTFAAPNLPTSTQVTETANKTLDEKIEIVPEIKIEAQATTSSPSNPQLKEGKACIDENLEEVQGELFSEIPMAKTIPCADVDCSELTAAKMHKDNYKKLNNAKTISCEK